MFLPQASVNFVFMCLLLLKGTDDQMNEMSSQLDFREMV